MPLIGAVDYQVSLPQQDILTFHHRVHHALIHIGQLQNGVGLTGEQEALFLFLIEEGVDPFHPELAVHRRLVIGLEPGRRDRPNQLRLLGGVEPYLCTAGEGRHGKVDPIPEGNIFIQAEVPEGFPIGADRQYDHGGAAADQGGGLGTVDHGASAVQLQ